IENVADGDALIAVIKNAKTLADKSVPFILGALSFFWYVELVERTLRVINSNGEDFSIVNVVEEFELHNLLYRRSHPCPLSRFIGAMKYVMRGDIGGIDGIEEDEYKNLISLWGYSCKLFEGIWKDNIPVLRQACKKYSLTVHAKWSFKVPNENCMLGIDYYL
ncbi:MAG: hypothetical protein AAFX55_21095, partial [Bacteroidota bacterium]